MLDHERCDECGSWGEECANEEPVLTCGCARCANAAKAEHHLCDLCCHEEPDAINKENRELREMLKKLEEEVEFLRGLCTYTASNINNQLFDFDRRPGGPLEPLKTQVRAQPRKKGAKS